MNQTSTKFRDWYDNRQMREKLCVVALGWAILYAIFSLIFFTPVDRHETMLLNSIKETQNQINTWHLQIDAIKKIPNTPLYKEWLNHRQTLKNLQGQYKFLLQQSPNQQWEGVVKTILQSQPNITLVEVKSLPETPYTSLNGAETTIKIYQQQLTVIVNSSYIDTINYLEKLETLLPNIHWDSLNYTVMKYPIGKVELEFSSIYEKN